MFDDITTPTRHVRHQEKLLNLSPDKIESEGGKKSREIVDPKAAFTTG